MSDDGPVCAWCDVYNRIECEARDESGQLVSAWTKCAYCGRTELRFGRRGHTTPVPKGDGEAAS
jgi:hypothetical protein